MYSIFYRIVKRVFLIAFIYMLLYEIYNNIIMLKSMYDRIIQHYSMKYKHTSYIYDCLYASCFHENKYLKCKCLLEN
jgi:hypothetical protein